MRLELTVLSKVMAATLGRDIVFRSHHNSVRVLAGSVIKVTESWQDKIMQCLVDGGPVQGSALHIPLRIAKYAMYGN
jgi:hypothetical protein